MKIKGKALMLRVGGKTIALATSCTFNTTTQTLDARTKDDAVGPSVEIDYVDWTASSDNIVGKNENVTNEMVYSELMQAQISGTILEVSVDLVSGATGAIPTGGWQTESNANSGYVAYGGKAIIESVSMSAPKDGHATVSVNFKAAGPLAPVNNTVSE